MKRKVTWLLCDFPTFEVNLEMRSDDLASLCYWRMESIKSSLPALRRDSRPRSRPVMHKSPNLGLNINHCNCDWGGICILFLLFKARNLRAHLHPSETIYSSASQQLPPLDTPADQNLLSQPTLKHSLYEHLSKQRYFSLLPSTLQALRLCATRPSHHDLSQSLSLASIPESPVSRNSTSHPFAMLMPSSPFNPTPTSNRFYNTPACSKWSQI
jgi:hypothetical protein